MAMSNADRQREYRARHLKDVEGTGERVNMIVSVQAKRSLERLAACYGVTQRELMERVIADAENALLAGLSGKKQTAYYDKQLSVTA